MTFLFLPTVKKDSEGYPQQRLHMSDAEGDKLLVTNDIDFKCGAVVIDTKDYAYVTLTAQQLRRMADWAEYAQQKDEEWLDSVDSEEWREACL